MKRRVLIVLLALFLPLCWTAAAEEWIPVTSAAAAPAQVTTDWNEPDSPLLAMTRGDGLIHAEDIDAPLLEFLQTRARCVFDTLRPSKLMQRLTWVTEVDLSPYEGTLKDARWLWMFDTESLTALTLTNASLEDLGVIGGFTELTELTLLNCGCFDLTPLTACTRLTTLTIGWDDEYLAAAGTFDLTPLTELGKLTTLALYGSGIQLIEPLSPIARQIRTLTLSDTAILDVELLSKYTKLGTLTLDLLHSTTAAEIMLAVNKSIKSISLKRIILNAEAEDAVHRFKSLTDFTLTDCDVANALFYEDLNKATYLTLESVSMPNGKMIGETYADKTTIVLRDVPIDVMLYVLDNRSSNLKTLTIDIEAMTAELDTELKEKTSLNILTIGVAADVDLSGDAWKRITGIRYLTIDSKGHTLLSTDFLNELTLVRTLTLSGVEIADSTGLGALENLGELYVYGCRIADWSFVENLRGLNIVRVYGSELTSDALPYFAGLRALDELRLDGNQITDLTALLASKTIRKLSVLNNPIGDYSVILKMPAIAMVYLDQGGVITGNKILSRSQSMDNIDYEAIYQEAFGAEEAGGE